MYASCLRLTHLNFIFAFSFFPFIFFIDVFFMSSFFSPFLLFWITHGHTKFPRWLCLILIVCETKTKRRLGLLQTAATTHESICIVSLSFRFLCYRLAMIFFRSGTDSTDLMLVTHVASLTLLYWILVFIFLPSSAILRDGVANNLALLPTTEEPKFSFATTRFAVSWLVVFRKCGPLFTHTYDSPLLDRVY